MPIDPNLRAQLNNLGGGWPEDYPFGDDRNQSGVFDGSLRDIWVNHSTGDDSNPGTQGSPLATIQEAIRRFKPGYVGMQTWNAGDDRTIHVMNGGVTITEQVVVPDHAGQGVLIIEGEEEVVYPNLQLTGVPSLVAGFNSVSRLTFTTAPMTANEFDVTANPPAFYRPNLAAKQAAGYSSPITQTFEDVAIVDNTAGTLDIVGSNFITIFGYAGGAVGDVVRPLLTWETTNSILFGQAPAIVAGSSPLIVSGFSFNAGLAGSKVLAALDPNAGPAGTRTKVLDRCTITPTGVNNSLNPVSGPFNASACAFLLANNTLSTLLDCVNVNFSNCVVPSGKLVLRENSYADLFGLYVMDSSTVGLQVQTRSSFSSFAADIRAAVTGLSLEFKSQTQALFGLSFGSAVGTCILVGTDSQLIHALNTATVTGTGTVTGIALSGRSRAALSSAAGAVLTGPALADIKVGSLAAAAYTATAVGSGTNDTAGDMSSYFRVS